MTKRPPSADSNVIRIIGAREHNLKNISVSIPRGLFVVITGVSGSGKSTLAFDLLFAEGQRRFLDSMNTYARQFVEQLSRPDVDLITGLPPTVSTEQRNSRGGGKSTVATVTEVYHFLRLLFARTGTQHCPDCDLPVAGQTRDQLGRKLRDESKKRGDLLLLAPVIRNRKGFHSEVAEWAAKHGYAEVRADGKFHSTEDPLRLDRFREHDVEIVTGVLDKKGRHTSDDQHLIDTTLKLGHGTLLALDNHRKVTVHSTQRSCPQCGLSFQELDPKQFSYNSPQGWCLKCRGFGELFYLPEVERGARAEAIEDSWFDWQEGKREPCPECAGARLNRVALAVHLDGARWPGRARARQPSPTIHTFSQASVKQALELFGGIQFDAHAHEIARDIVPEILERLTFLDRVGLGYLELGRSVTTLSGGEAQRIRLSAQLGSNLTGVLYVLDEPTIGLHPRDNHHLLDALQMLKDRGNSLIVVEHDEDTMRRADHVVDLGPGAGVRGGEIVASGTLEELLRHEESITGQCLRAIRHYPANGQRRPVSLPLKSRKKRAVAGQGAAAAPSPEFLILHEPRRNNLQMESVVFPLRRLVVVTGVSGSGKSTLVRECLLPAVTEKLQRRPGKSWKLTGHELLQSVYEVDQSPIGRTPRSTPATYVGFFDEIRKLFAQVPEARLRGYGPGRFSFNSAQGRCPECEGAGSIKLEMNFLPPAFVRCESCGGSRFNRETLDIEYAGRNVAQVLDLSVDEALEFFSSVPRVHRPLQALADTGLGFMKLGQTSPTLSGGEAQRVKLVTHLIAGLKQPDLLEASPKRNLFILEEPTIGLHMSDVHRLVEVLQRLVQAGHSVVVIEHDLGLIAEADWVIDLGPEAGAGGGRIVAEGTPEQIAAVKESYTGQALKPLLARSAGARPSSPVHP